MPASTSPPESPQPESPQPDGPAPGRPGQPGSPVEAVIVAGGFGSRLLPLTTNRPKHLLEVGGVPFLEHQLSRLAAAGVGHVVVATSYRAELFEPVLGDGSRWGIRVDYVQEVEPLGTAGAIRNVASALAGDPEGAVVVLNGDVLSGHDLAAQLRDFETPRDGRPVDVSLHLVEVEDARAFGCVPTDAAGRVTGFTEKSDHPVTNQVNAGCYVFRRRVVDQIPEHRVVSVERETFPGLVRDGALVVGHVENAYWRDVGTPEALVAASRDLVLGTAPSPAVPEDEALPEADGLARIDGSARVDPTARVDGGSVVVRDAVVGADAVVTGSVLMAGATVEAAAAVLHSVVGPGARVGRGVRLDQVTVGDGAVLEPGTVLPPGHRVDCDARLPDVSGAGGR
jgi:mannose-1-phosphate guanylyltransferase